jgi:hypothetical protein
MEQRILCGIRMVPSHATRLRDMRWLGLATEASQRVRGEGAVMLSQMDGDRARLYGTNFSLHWLSGVRQARASTTIGAIVSGTRGRIGKLVNPTSRS